jgi:hypothetical protein
MSDKYSPVINLSKYSLTHRFSKFSNNQHLIVSIPRFFQIQSKSQRIGQRTIGSLRFLKGTGMSSSLIIILNFFKRTGTGGSLILAVFTFRMGSDGS